MMNIFFTNNFEKKIYRKLILVLKMVHLLFPKLTS
jgi:hypothetical protein